MKTSAEPVPLLPFVAGDNSLCRLVLGEILSILTRFKYRIIKKLASYLELTEEANRSFFRPSPPPPCYREKRCRVPYLFRDRMKGRLRDSPQLSTNHCELQRTPF